jgi:hypothetical protein
MLTSSNLKSLVYTCLTAPPQQKAAAGGFSNPAILSDDERLENVLPLIKRGPE